MKELKSVTAFRVSAVLLISAPFLSAQFPANSLCDTGRTPKSVPPYGCLTTVAVNPVNPMDGGPIVDGNWKLATPYPSAAYGEHEPNPCTLAYEYSPAPVSAPSNAWYNPDDHRSQWIEPLGGGYTPAGWYIYETSFLVPEHYEGYPAYILELSGQFLADNTVGSIYVADLDGDATTCKPVAAFTNSTQYLSWTQFKAAVPVLPGTVGNVFFVVLNDTGGVGENPTGLRVEFTGSNFRPF